MTNILNEAAYILPLVGIFGIITGWLLTKLFAQKWKNQYQNLIDKSYTTQSLLDKTEAQKFELDETIERLTSELALKNADNNTLVKAFNGLQSQRNIIKTQLESSKLNLVEIEDSNNELSDKNISLVNKLDIAVKDKNNFKDLEIVISDLNNANANLRQELSTNKTTTQETNKKLNEEKVIHNKLLQEHLLLESSHATIKSKLTSVQQKLNQSDQEANQEIRQLTTLKETFEAKLTDINIQWTNAKEEVANLQDFNVKADHKQATAQAKIKQLEEELRESKAASAKSRQQLQAESEKNTLLNTTKQTLTSERDQLIKNIQKHTHEKIKFKTLKEEVKELKSDNTKLNIQLIQKSKETENISDLNSTIKSLGVKNRSLVSDLKISQRSSPAKDIEELNKKNRMANDEIERHKTYLINSETRWAKELNTLHSKMDIEKNNYSQALQQSNTEKKEINAKLLSIISKNNELHKTLEQTKDNTERKNITRNSTSLPTKDTNKKLNKKLEREQKNSRKLAQKINKLKKERDTLSDNLQQKEQSDNSSSTNEWRNKYQKLLNQKSNQGTSKQTVFITKNSSSHNTRPAKPKNSRYPIEAIEGIGIVYGKRFRNIKVDFVDTLLTKGKSSAGRKSLADRTDIDSDLISTWVSHADLFRVNGIEGDYAELLGSTGINTVQALHKSKASNLTKRIKAINIEKQLASQTPKKQEVASWIAHAADLKPELEYDVSININETEEIEPKIKTIKKPDALTKIKGIGKVNEKILHSLGIKTFAQIAQFTEQDEKEYGEKLNSFHDRISQEEWVKQAKALQKGIS